MILFIIFTFPNADTDNKNYNKKIVEFGDMLWDNNMVEGQQK